MRILRASAIGHPCMRRIWYEMTGEKQKFDRRTLRNFGIGNALEQVVVDDLRLDNWEVEYNKGSQSSELEVRLDLGNGAIISGHPDICMKRAGNPEISGNLLADIKTMKSASFVGWRSHGTLNKYPQYADQLTVYWAGLKENPVPGWEFDAMAVVGLNKDNSEQHIDVFDFEPDRLARIINKATYISTQDSPPDPGEIPRWTCSYCGYSSICTRAFGCKAPKTAEGPATSDGGIVADENVKLAAIMLVEAKRAKLEAEANEKEAKAILLDYATKNSASRFRAGNISVSIKQSSKTSIDSASLQAQYPDLAAKFRKTSYYPVVNTVDLEAGD